MAFGDSDIPFMLQDFGVPVQLGGYSDVGLLDDFEQRDGFGSVDVDVVSRIRKVEVQSGAAVTTPFRRASTATYTDVNGIVQTAGVNVLRNAHYEGGVLQPPLHELAGTNIALSSEALGGTGFIPPGSTNVTVTPDTTVAPDGQTTADTVTRIAGAGDKRLQQNRAVPNDSTPWCFSLKVRKTSGDPISAAISVFLTGGTTSQLGHIRINTDTGVILSQTGAGVSGVINFNATYWRLWASVTNNSTGNNTLAVSFYPDDDGTSGAGSKAAWGWQMENTAFPTTYMPSTSVAAGTRAADIDQLFAATTSGYSRQIGSFLTEGFKTGRKIKPVGFVSNPQSVITDVTDLTVTVSDRRSAEAAVAGRSLYFGLPGLKRGSALTVDGTAVKVRDLMQVGDGALTEIHVVTP